MSAKILKAKDRKSGKQGEKNDFSFTGTAIRLTADLETKAAKDSGMIYLKCSMGKKKKSQLRILYPAKLFFF